MSRIGKKPIKILSGVSVDFTDGFLKFKGPKGELSVKIFDSLDVKIENNEIIFSKKEETRKAEALWGLQRTLANNCLIGVTKGFEKKLEVVGVGYKVDMAGKNLMLKLGYSHPIEFKAPEGISFSVDKNIISVFGINNVLVGDTAFKIRALRKPEVYKGKGVRYFGEKVKIKEIKKAGGK
ncbi:MAG: 50S ribosomal protein L6 [Patescibacteria group bacterium]